MTNTVCMEPKETKPKRMNARALIGKNFNAACTAFIGRRNNSHPKDITSPTKLFLVNRRSVFDADNPYEASCDTDRFVIDRWVDVEIYVDEKECA